jgi:oxalate decarboxylase
VDADRRAFLGTAALGAGGLVALANAAAADRVVANPGEGGYGRNAVQLPPGDAVAYHDPKDVGAMPDFRFSLDGNRPKITTGGWAKEATVHQFPISKTIAGVHMFLDPGASRELHWHAIAAEWAYVIDGRCQTVVLDPSGASEINNYVPGDLWYFPKGHGHSIQTIGDKGRPSSRRSASPAPGSSRSVPPPTPGPTTSRAPSRRARQPPSTSSRTTRCSTARSRCASSARPAASGACR